MELIIKPVFDGDFWKGKMTIMYDTGFPVPKRSKYFYGSKSESELYERAEKYYEKNWDKYPFHGLNLQVVKTEEVF